MNLKPEEDFYEDNHCAVFGPAGRCEQGPAEDSD